MNHFRGGSGALSNLPYPARLLYAGFLGLTTLGFITSLGLYYDALGLSLRQTAAHYLGNADDPSAPEILVEKSIHDLLQVSHFHLYTMPVILLVLAHLFLLSRGGAWKGAVVAVAVLCTGLHVAGPWLVRFGGPGWAWVMPVTGLPFALSYGIMALWPIPELLRRRPRSS